MNGRISFFARACIPALAMLTLLGGCTKDKPRGEGPEVTVEEGGKKRSAFGRIFAPGADAGPQYGWDGQWSSFNMGVSPDVAYNRSVDGLRALGFTVTKEERGTPARIDAAKLDKTIVSVAIEASEKGGVVVKAKVGGLGERTGSERVLDEIQNALRRVPVRRAKTE